MSHDTHDTGIIREDGVVGVTVESRGIQGVEGTNIWVGLCQSSQEELTFRAFHGLFIC
ncbi:hypothetical protein [Halomonas huangheensis]|uniref:hypothetical protein n=1 Tax=Halomonas huangheensis TaxID=1178482 RepID=UPI0012DD2CDE|nr:hypothetical protein [Halomonas huangheensis]